MIKNLVKQLEDRAQSIELSLKSGSSLRYKGRQLILHIEEAEAWHVALYGKKLTVTSTDTEDQVRIQSEISDWYKKKAHSWLPERFERLKQEFAPDAKVELVVKTLRKSWGLYRRKDGVHIITLNQELIEAPAICVDYVIIHELTHIRHPNHSKKFYSVLAHRMPEWKKVKERLEVWMHS